MRNILCLAVLVYLVAAAYARHIEYEQEDLTSEERLLQLFEKWAIKHSRHYSTSDGSSQKHFRFQVFKQNLAYIHKHNNEHKASSHRLGLTRFADLTLDEFKARHFGFRNRASPVALRQCSSVCDVKKLPSWCCYSS
ncbi:hypothetical protein L7F22_030140 [Adiantum nelumboides]|nr:hypothetical protein [Adiantum nelumboides]